MANEKYIKNPQLFKGLQVVQEGQGGVVPPGPGGNYMPISGGTFTGNVSMAAGTSLVVNNPVSDNNPSTKKYTDDSKAAVLAQVSAEYLKLAGGAMTGDLAMGGNKVSGLATPTDDGDAANKKYVEDRLGGLVGGAAGALIFVGGFNASTGKIAGIINSQPGFTDGQNLPAPSATNKNFFMIVTQDGTTPVGTIPEGIKMDQGDFVICNGTAWVLLAIGSKDLIAANVKFTKGGGIDADDVQNAISELDQEKASLTGATFTGSVTLAADPTQDKEASTKKYVDDTKTKTLTEAAADADTKYLKLVGGALTGGINMSNQKITGLAVPTAATDAATMKFVEDSVQAVSGAVSGALIFVGGFNASTGRIDGIINAQTGFDDGQKLPAAAAANKNRFMIVTAAGTTPGDAVPAGIKMEQGDFVISNGNEWQRLAVGSKDLIAANVSFASTATVTATNVQDAIIELDTRKASLAGATFTGSVTLAADPTQDKEASTKKYVDDAKTSIEANLSGKFLNLSGGTMTGAIDMGGNKLTNVVDPAVSGDAANMKYVNDSAAATLNQVSVAYLKLVGGTLTGEINMSNQKITGLKDPAVATDASTKKYVDDTKTKTLTEAAADADTKYLKLVGGALTGGINMSNQKITGLAVPTAATDAATMKFVEDSVQAIGGAVSGALIFVGGFNASTGKIAGIINSQPGFTDGQNLPAPSAANKNFFMIVTAAGTTPGGTVPAGIKMEQGDFVISNGNEWQRLAVGSKDLIAANVSFASTATVTATNVQDAIIELDTKKASLAGAIFTGNLDLSNNLISGLGDPANDSDAANKRYVDTSLGGYVKSGTVSLNAQNSLKINAKHFGNRIAAEVSSVIFSFKSAFTSDVSLNDTDALKDTTISFADANFYENLFVAPITVNSVNYKNLAWVYLQNVADWTIAPIHIGYLIVSDSKQTQGLCKVFFKAVTSTVPNGNYLGRYQTQAITAFPA